MSQPENYLIAIGSGGPGAPVLRSRLLENTELGVRAKPLKRRWILQVYYSRLHQTAFHTIH